MRDHSFSKAGDEAPVSIIEKPPMERFDPARLLSFGISEAGHLVFAGIFLNALLYPAAHAEFILKTSPLIFIIEFLSIHSGAMINTFSRLDRGFSRIASDAPRWARYVGPMVKVFIFPFFFGLYAMMAYQWGLHLGNITLPFYFAASLIANYFGRKSAPQMRMAGYATVLILVSFFVAQGPACFWEKVFPFPEEIYRAYRSSWFISGAGECLYAPQPWPVWGLLYYSSLAIMGGLLFWRYKGTGEKNSEPWV